MRRQVMFKFQYKVGQVLPGERPADCLSCHWLSLVVVAACLSQCQWQQGLPATCCKPVNIDLVHQIIEAGDELTAIVGLLSGVVDYHDCRKMPWFFQNVTIFAKRKCHYCRKMSLLSQNIMVVAKCHDYRKISLLSLYHALNVAKCYYSSKMLSQNNMSLSQNS